MTHYVMKDQEFIVGDGPGKYRSPFTALIAAIKEAVAYAETEDIDIFRVDETGVHLAYKVDRKPHRQRTGWHDARKDRQ